MSTSTLLKANFWWEINLCIDYRFNYKVNEVFRELMGCTGGIGGFHLAGMNFSQAHDKDKCTIL